MRAVHRAGRASRRAVYLEEYADRERWWNRVIEVNIQNLAAVPSVVYGILGLAFIVRGPVDVFGLGEGQPTLLAGALTLGLLVLPVVIIVAREAIRAVPPSIREGSLALGATQWQTIWKQVLPGRAAGHRHRRDPRAVARDRRDRAADPRRRRRVPALQPRARRARSPRCRSRSSTTSASPRPIFRDLAAATILVLLAILLLMNSVAIYLRNRYETKW